MNDITNFDEINRFSAAEIEQAKESYYWKYFSEMPELDEEQIAKRVKTAEKFEDGLLKAFALAVVLAKADKPVDDVLQAMLTATYTDVGTSVYDNAEYIKMQAERFATQVGGTTIRNIDSEYFTSIDRAERISEDEANILCNYEELMEAWEQGYTRKTWVTMCDKHVRDSHRRVNGKTIGLFDLFELDSGYAQVPCDTENGLGAEDICNCRCSVKYSR